MQFRSDHTEPSVQFRSDHTDPSVQFRKANTDPSMQFRWGHTEFLFFKMRGKNLGESLRQLIHSQIIWHTTLIILVTSLICSVYFAYNRQFTMPCYAMICHVMSCHVLCHVPCAIQRHLAPKTKSSACKRHWYLQRFS